VELERCPWKNINDAVHTGEDGDLRDVDRLNVLTIRFDDLESVTVDGEAVVGVARERDQTEAVLFARLDVDN
jgi:hypothetical protein